MEKSFKKLRQLLGKEWEDVMDIHFEAPYFSDLMKRIEERAKLGKVHPESTDIFNAFYRCPPTKTKVVILGQDPYPNDNAHGLSFSSCLDRRPPSLLTIFKEILSNYGLSKTALNEYFPHNNLTSWANQGVLLLNSVLTVDVGKPNSHEGFGWQQFTEGALSHLISTGQPLVIMAWGKSAKAIVNKVCGDFPPSNLLILEAGHPATAAYGKDLFSGNNHFRTCNDFLSSKDLTPIKWLLKTT